MNKYFPRNRLTTFFISLVSASIFVIATSALVIVNDAKEELTDSLPNVFNRNQGNLIISELRHEANLKFPLYQLPSTKKEWDTYRVHLKNQIIKKRNKIIAKKKKL